MDQKFLDRLESARAKYQEVGITRAKYFIPALEDLILQAAEKGVRELSWGTTELSDVPQVALKALERAVQDHFAQVVEVRISSPDAGGRLNVEARW